MSKRGMDGFSEIMPRGDGDNLVAVDDLSDSLSTDTFFE